MDFKNSQHCAELPKVSLFASNAMSFFFFFFTVIVRGILESTSGQSHTSPYLFTYTVTFSSTGCTQSHGCWYFFNVFLFHCAVLLCPQTWSYIKIQSSTTRLIQVHCFLDASSLLTPFNRPLSPSSQGWTSEAMC